MYTPAFIFIRIFHFFIMCDVLNARFRYCPYREEIHFERSCVLHSGTLDSFISPLLSRLFLLLLKQLLNGKNCIVICLVFSEIFKVNEEIKT